MLVLSTTRRSLRLSYQHTYSPLGHVELVQLHRTPQGVIDILLQLYLGQLHAVIHDQHSQNLRALLQTKLPVDGQPLEAQLFVFAQREAKEILGVEIHQCVDERVRRIGPELFRLPEVFFFYPSYYDICE